MQPQSQAVGNPRPVTATATATSSGTRPGNCWYCGTGGHWRFECEVFKKAQMNNKISNSNIPEGQFSTQLALCAVADVNGTHESITGKTNSKSEVNIQRSASNEKVCDKSISSKPSTDVSPMGRLQSRYAEWEKVTDNRFILGVIKEGYKIPFKEMPKPVELKNNKFARDNLSFVKSEVQKLLAKGCVEKIEGKPIVTNPLTVSTNKSGKHRLVLDCRHLNECLAKFKFKYEDVSVARQLFEKGTYLFAWDLRSAYHHISVWGPHRAYLGCCVEEDQVTQYYVFCALPFGLSTSGYIFSKVIRVLVQYWRAAGLLAVMFLDDGIGGHKDWRRASESSKYIESSLNQFGFLIAEDKCSWEPTLTAVWLGYFWNMIEGKLYVTEDRIRRLEVSLESLLSYIGIRNIPLVKVRMVACVVGQIISMQTVLGKIVQLKTRELYKCILSRASWNAPVKITEKAVLELQFWRQNLKPMNAKGQNVSPNLDAQIFVYSDASNEGYGGYVSYFDSVFDNASVKDGRQPVESICVDSYSDVVKVDHRLYGNMSDRIMVCSECTGSHFVTEDDFWHVNEDMPEINQVHESDVVLESDVALIGAEALHTGKQVLGLNFSQSEIRNRQKRGFDTYLEKVLKAHENMSQYKFIEGSEVTGSWSQIERLKSSTWREVEAVRRVMLYNAGLLEGKKVNVYSDNKNVKSVLLKGSAKAELQNLALRVNDICVKREITLNPAWLSRNQNERADILSKSSPADDWSINNWVFEYLSKKWGNHDIDRFSSNLNNKCYRFNSKYWVPGTEAIDAFDQNWQGVKNWMVPPPSVGSKVIKKVIKDKADGTLILPKWRSAPFWPLLLESNCTFKKFIRDHETLPRANIISAGRCKKGIFTNNPLSFNMIAFQIRF